jgi:hypothetical protein
MRTKDQESISLRCATHKLAVALHFGVYNFVRQHHSLGNTPAAAAGLEEKPWSLEKVVKMTEAYMRRKTNCLADSRALGL